MKLTRYIKPEQIKLELETLEACLPEPTHLLSNGQDGERKKPSLWDNKNLVLKQIVDLFDNSGKIANKSKLFTDIFNRERKASTAIGGGLAIPHVRTIQAKDLVIAFARSTPGVEFDAIDGQKVHLFFCVVAPPYDDALYLNIYKNIAMFIKQEDRKKILMSAQDEHEVIKTISDFTV